ncbi:MAG: rhomboid family intramembrane serine protease [Acidimicrobiia bacterium]|nr:rhomboid family intramembrane serine protease [Acidimicrobiia bacterium]
MTGGMPDIGQTEEPTFRQRAIGALIGTAFGWVALYLLLIWSIEIIDTFLLGSSLQGGGIHPRDQDGLDGILWAPFLHSDWGHVVSNSGPLAILGGLTALRGRARWLTVTVAGIVIGGGLVWLFGRSANHIGSSGVIFGYFGALLGAAVFERRPRAIAPALVAIMLYYGLLVGLVPQEGISWEGHLFGMVAGLIVAKLIVETRKAAEEDDVDLSAFPPDFDFGDQP